MNTVTLAQYMQQADTELRGPHLNEQATGRAANLTAGWGVYNGQVIPFYDQNGNRHMITEKQHKVYLWAMGRLAMLDTSVKLRDVAAELGVSVATVSTMLRKLMAWGKIVYWSVRGRYGKTVLWPRRKGDGLERFVIAAKAKIRAIWQRRTAKLSTNSNVWTLSSGRDAVTDMGDYGSYPYTVGSSTNIRNADRLAEALGCDPSRSSGRVPCPAHGEHRSKTLSWKRTAQGGLMVHCFAGCTYDQVKAAAGI